MISGLWYGRMKIREQAILVKSLSVERDDFILQSSNDGNCILLKHGSARGRTGQALRTNQEAETAYRMC